MRFLDDDPLVYVDLHVHVPFQVHVAYFALVPESVAAQTFLVSVAYGLEAFLVVAVLFHGVHQGVHQDAFALVFVPAFGRVFDLAL